MTWRNKEILNNLSILLVLVAVFGCFAFGGIGSGSHLGKDGDPDVYYFVLDHSSSMREAGRDGVSHWLDLQNKVCDRLDKTPLGSAIYVHLFSDRPREAYSYPFDTESDRDSLKQTIRNGLGLPRGRTKLFDALGRSFEATEKLFLQNKKRFVRVLLFSDGIDNTSDNWTKGAVQSQFTGLMLEHPNVWLFYEPIGASPKPIEEIILHARAVERPGILPTSIKMETNRLTFVSTVSDAEDGEIEFDPQRIRCEITSGPKELSGRISMTPQTGGVPGLMIEPISLENGLVRGRMSLPKSNSQVPGVLQTGKLSVTWSEPSEFVHVEPVELDYAIELIENGSQPTIDSPEIAIETKDAPKSEETVHTVVEPLPGSIWTRFHFLRGLVVLLIAILVPLLWILVLRKVPHDLLYFDSEKPPGVNSENWVSIDAYWNMVSQSARIPMRELCISRKSKHWIEGDGKNEYLWIRPTKESKITYSSKDSVFVFASTIHREETGGYCYQFADSRCPIDENPRWFLMLVEGRGQRNRSWIVASVVASLVGTIVVCYCLAF